MFSKLKDKLKNWAKKISKEEEIIEETPKKEKKKPKEKKEKPKKIKDKKKQEEKEKKSFIKKLIEKKIKISEEKFKEYSEDLEFLLLENNVALEVSNKINKNKKEKLINKEFSKKEIENEIKKALKETIEEILIEPFNLIKKIKEKKQEPYVILFCGINGSGKTTTIAKLVHKFKENEISCVLSASDTFRAAAIDQLKKHGERLGVKVISQKYGADPTAVSFDAIKYAKKNHIQCVLIDTAGRIHTAKNLMAEIEKINRVCKPDIKIFVGESTTGNDSVEQVKAFDEAINLDGIILAKADTDEKGGTALSVGYVTKKPILFLGTGQEYKDIEKFDKKKFIEKLGL